MHERIGRPTVRQLPRSKKIVVALDRRVGRRVRRAATWSAVASLLACSPIVRPPTFTGARDQVADASLRGPFNGQIVDAVTKSPIGDATVVGVWSYERGDGLVAPAGSDTRVVRTDRAGRYRIDEVPARRRGPAPRLVGFTLFVYKRGYLAYRSDVPYDGGMRADFVARHNRIALRKWSGTDSHAEHLLMLSPPPEIERLTAWERGPANTALLGRDRGTPTPEQPGPAAIEVLDATALLTPEEIRRRTGYTDAFQIGELTDLARTHFYHGVHLRAVDREERWDVGLRVWKDPPGGLQSVLETFQATLPGVEATPEITGETYVFDSESVRAVAFVDRERSIAVLLTCGAMQCADVETALVLARHVHDSLDALRMIPADQAGTAPSTARSPETPAQPGADATPPAPAGDR